MFNLKKLYTQKEIFICSYHPSFLSSSQCKTSVETYRTRRWKLTIPAVTLIRWCKLVFEQLTLPSTIQSACLNKTACTGCFINSVTILNLYIIKISPLNCLTSKYYKNMMICILFGIKIDPYFHNLGHLYENLKKEQFLWCVQNDVTVRVFKTEGTNNPNWASSGSHCIWLSLHIMTSLWDYSKY